MQGVKDKFSELSFDLDDDQVLYDFGKSIGTSALKVFLQDLKKHISDQETT